MGRLILGVVVGYVAMALILMATFSMAYVAMGTEGAYRPGSYDISTLWVLASIVLGFIAAVVGGLICLAIAKRPAAGMTLAVVVLVLGFIMAIPVVMSSDEGKPQVRAGDVGLMEAMQSAKQPAWLALLTPITGAVGALVGGRLKGGAGSA